MIEIKQLALEVSDKANAKLLLENFSAKIVSGERIGIFGPNGAGKSTFLKGLMGGKARKSGEVLLNDQPIENQCHKIAYLPQEFDTLPVDYSVMGFLQLLIHGNKWGIPWYADKDKLRCRIVLEQVNAWHLRDKLIKELSGGERKRIMLAALLLEEPEVLFLDEPLANLDPRYQHELLALIEQLQKKLNLTLLITAHDFNPLLHLLDRVMFIGEGKAVLDQPENVIQSSVLSNLYQTPLEVVELKGRKWVLSNGVNERQVFLNPGEHCHGKHCSDHMIMEKI